MRKGLDIITQLTTVSHLLHVKLRMKYVLTPCHENDITQKTDNSSPNLSLGQNLICLYILFINSFIHFLQYIEISLLELAWFQNVLILILKSLYK